MFLYFSVFEEKTGQLRVTGRGLLFFFCSGETEGVFLEFHASDDDTAQTNDVAETDSNNNSSRDERDQNKRG